MEKVFSSGLTFSHCDLEALIVTGLFFLRALPFGIVLSDRALHCLAFGDMMRKARVTAQLLKSLPEARATVGYAVAQESARSRHCIGSAL